MHVYRPDFTQNLPDSLVQLLKPIICLHISTGPMLNQAQAWLCLWLMLCQI